MNQNEGETKASVSPDSFKPNLKYLVILYGVGFGGTGKIIGRNARFYERKIREKSGRQSSLGNPRKVHPAFFIIPSHYIRFNTVIVCKI